MGRPPVRGLSYLQVDKHGITIIHTTYISVDLAHQKIVRAKVGMGGINHTFNMINHIFVMSIKGIDLQSHVKCAEHETCARKNAKHETCAFLTNFP